MEEEIVVVGQIHPSLLVEEVDVATQLLAVCEGVQELLHDLCLHLREAIGVIRIDGGEVGILEWVRLTIREGDRPCP